MKFSYVAALFTFSATAFAAVDLSALPACSFACFTAGAAAAGCGIDDVVCQCTTGRTALTNSVTPCVMKNCNPADQQQAAQAAITICDQALSSTKAGPTATSTTGGSGGSNVTIASATAAGSNVAGSNKAELFVAGAGVLAALVL